MRFSFFAPLLILLAVLLTACTPSPGSPDNQQTSSPTASDESRPTGYPTAAAQAAQQALAERLDIDAGDITVESTQAREWSDSCLGLGGPAESCLQVITPGYEMVLVYDNTEYRYRTDEQGTAVRAEE